MAAERPSPPAQLFEMNAVRRDDPATVPTRAPDSQLLARVAPQTFSVDLVSREKVWSVKAKLQAKAGIPVCEQRLLACGSELLDDSDAAGCIVSLPATVHLLLRLRGGGPKAKISKAEKKELERKALKEREAKRKAQDKRRKEEAKEKIKQAALKALRDKVTEGDLVKLRWQVDFPPMTLIRQRRSQQPS